MTPFDLLKKIYNLIPDGFSVGWSHKWGRHHKRCVFNLEDARGNTPKRLGIVIEEQWIQSGDIDRMLGHLIATAIHDMQTGFDSAQNI
jgi:hypothetical protein